VRLTAQNLVTSGALSAEAAEFVKACVIGRKNILVSGGTGSGKTTLLNVLSAFIPSDERIVTVEDSAELKLAQEHVVTLETKVANIEGKGGYSIRDLVRNALRMRPDRILVGECRGAETLDMLQAMNTGHAGSMTTAHANSPQDCLLRLEVMAMQAAEGLTVQSIREQIAAALDLVVQVQRVREPDTGRVRREVTSIAEVIGIDERDGTVRTREIMGRIGGALAFTGYLPSFLDELVENDLLDLDGMFAAPEPARETA
jgi:pilus assembly protein CpaF